MVLPHNSFRQTEGRRIVSGQTVSEVWNLDIPNKKVPGSDLDTDDPDWGFHDFRSKDIIVKLNMKGHSDHVTSTENVQKSLFAVAYSSFLLFP
jgi:hypothetical protein